MLTLRTEGKKVGQKKQDKRKPRCLLSVELAKEDAPNMEEHPITPLIRFRNGFNDVQ
jgi:hypothetical protein